MNLDWYDYGARFYDPALGRFTGLDPIAEDYYYVTPYNYAENSPIANIDLWGLQALSMHLTTGLAVLEAKYRAIASQGGNPLINLLVGSTRTDRIPSEVKSSMNSQTQEMIDASGKLSDATTITEVAADLSQEIVGDVLDGSQTVGDALTIAGYVAAPFTGGASLSLVLVGEAISSVSGGAKTAIAVSQGDYSTAAIEGTGLIVGKGTSKLAKTAVNQSIKVGTIKAGSKEAKTHSGVLSAISSLFTRASKKIAKEEKKD